MCTRVYKIISNVWIKAEKVVMVRYLDQDVWVIGRTNAENDACASKCQHVGRKTVPKILF
jgi:hypothetical protein